MHPPTGLAACSPLVLPLPQPGDSKLLAIKMVSRSAHTCLLPLLFLVAAFASSSSSSFTKQREEAISLAVGAISSARSLASAMVNAKEDGEQPKNRPVMVSWADCARLYEDSESRLQRLLVGDYELSDARTWLSAAVTCHATCMEGLSQTNASAEATPPWTATVSAVSRNVTEILRRALALHALPEQQKQESFDPQVQNWTTVEVDAYSASSRWDADLVVAQDGSGNYKTINDAVASLGNRRWQLGGDKRLVIYIKAGVYQEYVSIDTSMRNLMLVGDGIDKTVVTGNRNVLDGYTTYSSATFGVSGDNFWARDITFENTAGPEKYQAVAALVAADHAVFYRCSFKGYQDTLLVHSQRQFYRDCQIYGTIDFIFGNAAAVIQNCDIYVRKPMEHQSNMITAQGRDDVNQNTGISIHSSRVRAAGDLEAAKGSFKSYLGRPWKKYSRTVFLKTDLDVLVSPEGWAKWSGDFALDTLYYGEYMNTGDGAETGKRVNWPGFHVLRDSDAAQFTVESFIQGKPWIAGAGVPFWDGL